MAAAPGDCCAIGTCPLSVSPLSPHPALAVEEGINAGRPSPGVLPGPGRREPETVMAKGQKKSNKEVRKPKANKDAPKANASQPSLKAGGIKGLENIRNN